MVEVGRKIRALRKKKGISSEKLGKLVGCSGANIRRIEEAEQSTRPETLERIAEASECDIGEIDPTRAGLTEASRRYVPRMPSSRR
jgi:transcriptional regulator with XRE-family HTH domain